MNDEITFNLNDDQMTVEEWNYTKIWVDDFLQDLDKKERETKPLEEKTEQELFLDKCATAVYEYAKSMEPSITNDIRLLADNTSGLLLGKYDQETGLINPSHVLKEKSSIERKILCDSIAYQGDYELASKKIRDSVRYTIIFEDDKYTEGVDEFLHELENLGYYDIEVKNNWGTQVCQGINVKLKNRDGMYFEIQFHTPFGHHIKEECTRTLYRIIREPSADYRLKFLANKLRRILQSRVKAPPAALEYKFISNTKWR